MLAAPGPSGVSHAVVDSLEAVDVRDQHGPTAASGKGAFGCEGLIQRGAVADTGKTVPLGLLPKVFDEFEGSQRGGGLSCELLDGLDRIGCECSGPRVGKHYRAQPFAAGPQWQQQHRTRALRSQPFTADEGTARRFGARVARAHCVDETGHAFEIRPGKCGDGRAQRAGVVGDDLALPDDRHQRSGVHACRVEHGAQYDLARVIICGSLGDLR
jgi:hypothetical protein